MGLVFVPVKITTHVVRSLCQNINLPYLGCHCSRRKTLLLYEYSQQPNWIVVQYLILEGNGVFGIASNPEQRKHRTRLKMGDPKYSYHVIFLWAGMGMIARVAQQQPCVVRYPVSLTEKLATKAVFE